MCRREGISHGIGGGEGISHGIGDGVCVVALSPAPYSGACVQWHAMAPYVYRGDLVGGNPLCWSGPSGQKKRTIKKCNNILK